MGGGSDMISSIGGLIALISILALIVVGIIGCVRECQQAGEYDGR